MEKKFVFTAGLPRAGTTLLGTILDQNPRFSASVSGPLARFTRAIIAESSSQGGYRHECPPEKRKKILRALFNAYHDEPTVGVYFNHNRGWPLIFPLVKELYPDAKLLLCVRDLGWVLDSFETLIRKNPLVNTTMFTQEENTSVYTRAATLLRADRVVGFAYNAVKQAITSEFKNDVMVIEYDYLARNPEQILRAVYNFIGEEYHEHDFSDVAASYDEFDEDVQLPGLHTTRKVVEFIPRETILPPDVWSQVEGSSVWR